MKRREAERTLLAAGFTKEPQRGHHSVFKSGDVVVRIHLGDNVNGALACSVRSAVRKAQAKR